MSHWKYQLIHILWLSGIGFSTHAQTQLDLGYEASQLTQNQAPWQQQSLQLTHFTENKMTALHGVLYQYHQFSQQDHEIELGIGHRFTSRITGTATISHSADAEFRPEQKISLGGEIRLDTYEIPQPAIWFTLDMSHATYETTSVNNINPGLRLELNAAWALSGHLIQVNTPDAHTSLGWHTQINHYQNNYYYYFGLSHAPETTDGVTLQTDSYFSGLVMTLNPKYQLRFDYSHERRDTSYTRDTVSSHISYSF